MKVTIKHQFQHLKELNFRSFEVVQTIGGKVAEIILPENGRKLNFGFNEVLIHDIEGVLEKFLVEGIATSDFDFVMNYLEHNYLDPEEIVVTFGCVIDSCMKKIKAEKKKLNSCLLSDSILEEKIRCSKFSGLNEIKHEFKDGKYYRNKVYFGDVVFANGNEIHVECNDANPYMKGQILTFHAIHQNGEIKTK